MSKAEIKKLLASLEKQMKLSAADLNFEDAAYFRDRIIEIKKFL